jgi:NADH-quinone oxidoreductase subunit A
LNPAPEANLLLWPLLLYVALVFLVVAAMLGLSYALGERHSARSTGEPYESGIPPTGSARRRLSAKFYLVAVFFVIFDLEAVFLFSWAVAFRDLGWAGYVEVLVFVGVLLAALVYLWRAGALEWGPRRRGEG